LNDERDEALELARRAHVLEQRFVDGPAPECSVLLARILAAEARRDEARGFVERVAETCPPCSFAPTTRAFFRMLQLVLVVPGGAPVNAGETTAAWADLVIEARGNLLPIELLELLYWHARTAVEHGRLREAAAAMIEARPLLERYPRWRTRFDELHIGDR
jgi:hypothetical protein